MMHRDEFDDPEGFKTAFGKISRAMEQSRSGMRRRGPMISILTAVVALFILFAVIWSSYPKGGNDLTEPAVPVVRADASSYMKMPEEPGGMDIPHRDSTVFDPLRASENDGDGRVESLLPPAEQPIDREKMFAGLNTEPIEENDVTAPLDPGPAPEAEADGGDVRGVILGNDMAAVKGPADAETPQEPAAEPSPAVAEAPEQNDEPDAKPAAGAEPAAGDASQGAGGTHYVQLLSIKDRKLADGEWKKMQTQFPSELSSLSMRVQDVDLGAKGTYYRIQGGLVSQSRAREICNAIASKRPGGCLVVAR